MRSFTQVMLVVVVVCLIYVPIVYFSHKESMECDEVVFLEGELSMDIREVDSYENGMSRIHLCDGTTMEVPTTRIIKIVSKDVQ